MKKKKLAKKIIIGITGGVATGKSTVAGMFRKLGARVIDADKIAHLVIRKGRPEYEKIVKAFGRTILKKNGEINRERLANVVFYKTRFPLLRKLEKIIHPAVWREISNIVKARRRGVLVVEVPLLFEAGWEKKFDLTVVVTCNKRQQIARSKERFINRIDRQLPLKRKIRRADFVIDNSGTLEETRRQVEMFKPD